METTLTDAPRSQLEGHAEGPAMSLRSSPRVVAAGVARVLGTYAALAGGLLFAQTHINQLLVALARISPLPPMRMDIVAWRTIVLAVALVHGFVMRLLRRWPLVAVLVETVLVVAVGMAAFHASPFLGKAFLIGLVPVGALLVPFVLTTEERPEHLDLGTTLTIGLGLQSIPLAWGVWITTFTFPIGTIVGGQIAAWCFSVWRASKRGRKESEAVAGVPFTLLPIVGLLREPSVNWVVLALGAYAAIRLADRASIRLSSFARRVPTTLADVAVVASFWGTCGIFTIPYRFRDLPRLNHNSHEATAYAAVNSILHGKFMMADAGMIYGPLRAYALTLYMLVAGVTAEQVRLGQALLNHATLAVLLGLGWRLVDRRMLAMVWFTYLLLTGTAVLVWINYAGYGMNAFG
jgi:hypothetical protein